MKYFFTFGQGCPYRNHYVEIWAPDEYKAREMMVEAHAQRWAFQYSETEFNGMAEKWNLGRLSLLNTNPANGMTVCEVP